MKKQVFINLLCSINIVFVLNSKIYAQNESINKGFSFEPSIGYSVFNQLRISYEDDHTSNSYIVNSKLKPQYSFSATYFRKKTVMDVGLGFYQSAFTGGHFVFIDYTSNKVGSTVIGKFNIYQKVRYNFQAVEFTIGRILLNKGKHRLSMSIGPSFIVHYNTIVNNYFSNEQYNYDTTNYALAKEVRVKKNFGFNVPRATSNINYYYSINNRLSVGLGMKTFISPINDIQNISATNSDIFKNRRTDEYFLAYNLIYQIILFPKASVKINFVKPKK